MRDVGQLPKSFWRRVVAALTQPAEPFEFEDVDPFHLPASDPDSSEPMR